MDGNFFGIFTFEPDNIQVANAAMILIMIPIFNSAIYPLLERCNLLTTSLQRVGLGFFFAALAFGVSGLLDLELEVESVLSSFAHYYIGRWIVCVCNAWIPWKE